MSDNWSNEITLQFLNLYEKHPVIWDPQNMNHKNRSIVADEWHDILKEIGIDCTVDTLKKKKESLMSTYRNVKKRVTESEKSRAASEAIYKPTWFAFQVMDRFLKNVVKLRPTISTDEVIESAELKIESDEETEVITESTSQEIVSDTYAPLSIKQKRKADTSLDIIEKSKKTCDSLETLSQREKHTNESDECTLYGQLIASKLRNFSRRSRLILINQIDNLIFQAQMKEMDNDPLEMDNDSVHFNISSI